IVRCGVCRRLAKRRVRRTGYFVVGTEEIWCGAGYDQAEAVPDDHVRALSLNVWMRSLRCSRLSAIALFLAASAALNTAQSGAALGQTTKPALEWAACGDVADTECAGLEVPVDYAKPNGAKFTLRLGRAPAVDPAKCKGVLLLLPGGPGPGIA